MTHDQQVWMDRWVHVLNSYEWNDALQQGIKSFLDGNVRQYRFTSGGMQAKVAGSKTRPETVQISVKPFQAIEWHKVLNLIASKALFGAMLLNGRMPESLAQQLAAETVPILPDNIREWHFTCTCGEQNSPCTHAAAAYFALGSEGTKDPWLLFEMRGMAREEILKYLRTIRREHASAHRPNMDNHIRNEQQSESQPLESDPDSASPIHSSKEDAWLLNRAGDPEFWNKDVPMQALFAPIYRKVANLALEQMDVPNIKNKE